MSFTKPIGLKEGISLDKALKNASYDFGGEHVVYSITFIERLSNRIYLLINHNNKTNKLNYTLYYETD